MSGSARSRINSWDLYAGPASTWTAGKLAAHTWLRTRALTPPALVPWHIEASLDVRDAPASMLFDERRDTRFRIEIYSEEWGLFFRHQGRASWIRVTDIAFVHGRDDFQLLGTLPALKDIGLLLRSIERQYSVEFRRDHALIRTNVPNAEPVVRAWVQSL